jgi:hypothetical protein
MCALGSTPALGGRDVTVGPVERRAWRARPDLWTSTTELGLWGYRALLILCFFLPFEFTQRPLAHTRLVTLTNLSALFYAAGAIGGLSSAQAWARGWRPPRTLLLLLCALAGIALVSSMRAQYRADGLKWTVDLGLGFLLLLAVPIWLADAFERKAQALAIALVAGAALAATIGLLEVLTPSLDRNVLSLFKAKPTVIGPYLRLSGTFEYANIAGGYLAAALPFALVLALSCSRRWASSSVGRSLFVPRREGLEASLAALAVLAISAALVLTLSRGALLGAAAGLSVVALVTRHRWMRAARVGFRNPVLAAAGLIAAVAGATGIAHVYSAGLRLTSQSDLEWYRSSISARLPSGLRPDSLVSVSVALRNPGPLVWRARGPTPFHLSYHWLLPDERVLVLDGRRTSLSHDLGPGESVRLRATVLTPTSPGRYLFAWDVVEEHVAWFGVHTGMLVSVPETVSGPRGAVRLGQRDLTPPAPAVTAPEQPERSTLWAAALRMIRSHRLLGIGPNGYRLSYGRYEQPPQPHWDKRIYANSLPLELAADLGVPWLVLFLGLLAVVLGPPLARSLHSGRSGICAAAVLALPCVFLVHGTVDYLLGSRAEFILFWVSLGLVAALPASSARPERTETASSTAGVPKK